MKKLVSVISAVLIAAVSSFTLAGCFPDNTAETPPKTPSEEPPQTELTPSNLSTELYLASHVDEDTVAVIGYSGQATGTLSIPETLNFNYINGEGSCSKKVVSIAQYAFANDKLGSAVTAVEIPPSVESIDDYAFYNDKYITSVVFKGESELTYIGQRAFSKTPNLKTFKITEKVQLVGELAFSDSGVTSFDTSESIYFSWENDLLFGGNVTDKSSKIAVYVNPEAETVSFPDAVKSFNYRLFYGNKKIKTVDLNKVTHIGLEAFVNSSVESIINADNVENVSFSDLANTPWLSSRLDDDIITLGKVWLKYAATDGQVIVPEGVVEIGMDCFKSESVTSVILPESLKSIGQRAFAGCPNLEWVLINAHRLIANGSSFNESTVIYVRSINLNTYKSDITFKFMPNELTEKQVEVTYSGVDGDILGTQSVAYYSIFKAEVSAPKIDGYYFAGWKDEEGNIIKDNALFKIYYDVTLTACYEPVKIIQH